MFCTWRYTEEFDMKQNFWDVDLVELFKRWIDESYRAQAPKRLIAQIAARVPLD